MVKVRYRVLICFIAFSILLFFITGNIITNKVENTNIDASSDNMKAVLTMLYLTAELAVGSFYYLVIINVMSISGFFLFKILKKRELRIGFTITTILCFIIDLLYFGYLFIFNQ